MARLDSFLRLVVEQQASDLHFSAGTVPTIRHDGDLVALPFRELSETETRRFLLETLTPQQRQEFTRTNDLDFVYEISGIGRFRANYYRQVRGLGAVFRVISPKIPLLESLELPDSVRRLTHLPSGLVLVTGPTGSGKTTTLAAMVNEINRTSHRHIITIEDPVEFIHTSNKSVITQRQVGVHVNSFSTALRSALREAPDVIVVGEMRDAETMSLALSAAETGSLVLGTLHTNSAATAIDRIIDAMSDEMQDQVRGLLSVLLRGVIAQHLLKRATGEGRVAAVEVLLQNFAISHLIRDKKIHQIDGVMKSSESAGSGMVSLDTCLYDYLRQGLVTLDAALQVAKQPEQLKTLAANLSEIDE